MTETGERQKRQMELDRQNWEQQMELDRQHWERMREIDRQHWEAMRRNNFLLLIVILPVSFLIGWILAGL